MEPSERRNDRSDGQHAEISANGADFPVTKRQKKIKAFLTSQVSKESAVAAFIEFFHSVQAVSPDIHAQTWSVWLKNDSRRVLGFFTAYMVKCFLAVSSRGNSPCGEQKCPRQPNLHPSKCLSECICVNLRNIYIYFHNFIYINPTVMVSWINTYKSTSL